MPFKKVVIPYEWLKYYLTSWNSYGDKLFLVILVGQWTKCNSDPLSSRLLLLLWFWQHSIPNHFLEQTTWTGFFLHYFPGFAMSDSTHYFSLPIRWMDIINTVVSWFVCVFAQVPVSCIYVCTCWTTCPQREAPTLNSFSSCPPSSDSFLSEY